MMDLFALKSKEGYLKFGPDGQYILVGINKASVYPITSKDFLLEQKRNLSGELEDIRVVKMTISEEDYYCFL